MKLLDTDDLWFQRFITRQTHIRVAALKEEDAAFRSLGEHDVSRRRIICWKVPRNTQLAAGKIVKIPYLVFGDETIADEDSVLLPIIHEIMMDAAKGYGMKAPVRR